MAVHKAALGRLDIIDKTLPHLRSIVNQFLPDGFSLVEIDDAKREIVAGVKYEILFRVLDEANIEETSCFIIILEKPWLQKDSQKYREMVYNNCSVPFLKTPPESSYSMSPLFGNKRQAEMTSGNMKDLESQIQFGTTNTEKPEVERTTEMSEEFETTTEKVESAETLNPSSKNMLDDIFNLKNYFEPNIEEKTTETPTTEKPLSGFSMDALDSLFGIKKEVKEQTFTANRAFPNINASPTERSSEESYSNSNSESKEKSGGSNDLNVLELEVKRTFSELFQNNPEFQRAITDLINEKNEQLVQEKYSYVFNILMSNLKEKIEKFSNRKVEDEKEPSVLETSKSPEHHHSKRSVDKDEILSLAGSSLAELDRYDHDDTKRVLLNVLNVKMTNINNQTRLLITLNVANSLCKENEENCEIEIDNQSSKTCFFEVIYFFPR